MSNRGINAYFVTGANSGVGLEAVRQLANHFSQPESSTEESEVIIYLLCRSKEKAEQAISDVRSSISCEKVRLEFLKFDAYDSAQSIRENIQLDEKISIRGILLNAGGFGDGKTTKTDGPECAPQACRIAKMNIIGHVVLVQHLLSIATATESTRIIASGSKACFASPGVSADYEAADFKAHLAGTVPSKDRAMGVDYIWVKGILALYWAAFAKRNPELRVLTVSPGAIRSTGLLHQKAVSPLVRMFALVSQWFKGSHSVQEGAQRYVDALLDTNEAARNAPSGSFLASLKGFAGGEFGNVATLPEAKFVLDEELQNKAWDAVNQFL